MATLDELIGSWALSVRAANRAPRTVAQYVDEPPAQLRRWMGRSGYERGRFPPRGHPNSTRCVRVIVAA